MPQVGHHLAARQIADGHQVQRAVVDARVGADLHAAAEEAAVAHGRQHHAPALALLAVHGQPDIAVVVRDQLAQRGGEERDAAAEPLGRRVGAAGDGAGEAERGDVDEVAHRFAAVVGAVTDAPGVDRLRARFADVVRGGADLVRKLQRAAKIAARAARDERDLGGGRRGARRQHTVGDLGDCPVAAQGDDQPPSRGGLAPGDRRRVARPGGERAVDLPQPVGERAADARPPRFGQPGTRARVDDDEGATQIHATVF